MAMLCASWPRIIMLLFIFRVSVFYVLVSENFAFVQCYYTLVRSWFWFGFIMDFCIIFSYHRIVYFGSRWMGDDFIFLFVAAFQIRWNVFCEHIRRRRTCESLFVCFGIWWNPLEFSYSFSMLVFPLWCLSLDFGLFLRHRCTNRENTRYFCVFVYLFFLCRSFVWWFFELSFVRFVEMAH